MNHQRWAKLSSKNATTEEFVELKKKLKLDSEGRLVLELPGTTVPQMIVLREFFARLQKTLEDEVGIEKARTIYHDAAAASAYLFAKDQAQSFSLRGIDIFRAYLKRASLRGWGMAEISEYDEKRGNCRFVIRHSYGEELARRNIPACHVWVGAAEGIMRAVLESLGRRDVVSEGKEIKCAAQGNEYCEFAVTTTMHARDL